MDFCHYIVRCCGRFLNLRLLRVLAILLVSLLQPFLMEAQAGTHAVGNNPANGAVIWGTNSVAYANGCINCHHSAGNPSGLVPDSTVLGGTFIATGFTKNSSGVVWPAAKCMANPNTVPAGINNCPNLTVADYAANPSNFSTAMLSVGDPATTATASGDMTVTSTSEPNAILYQEDISAYFATLQTPQLANPGNSTWASNSPYSYQVAALSPAVDYLVSTTTYSATGLPPGYAINATTGAVTNATTGRLPTPAVQTGYTVTLSATQHVYNPVTLLTTTGATGSVTFTLTVNPPAPAINSATTANAKVGTAFSYSTTTTAAATATAFSATGLPPGLGINTTTGVISGTPTALATGSPYGASIGASNPGGAATPITLTITVAPEITSALTASGNVGAAFSYAITASNTGAGNGTISYSATGLPPGLSINTTNGAISGTPTTVTGSPFTVTISASNAAGAGASKSLIITINQGSQTITGFTAPASVAVGATALPLSATGGASGNAVTFSSGNNALCTVSGNVVTGVAVGTCPLYANQLGNADYAAATQAATSITVGKGSQTIIGFAAPASVTVGGTATASLSVTGGGASGNPVTFSSLDLGFCTVTGNSVTGVAAGTCRVAADQAGNANYNAATQQVLNVAVGKNAQTITFGAAPAITYVASPLATGTVSATASSNLPVSFSSVVTPSVCTVSGAVVTAQSAGSCTINADQAGDGTWSAAPLKQLTFTIAQAAQAITWGTLPSVTVGATGTLSATGGASGNAVTFTSQTPAICTVAGVVVTGKAVGTCTVAADQASNTNYAAATQLTRSITIGKGSQSISFVTLPTVAVGGTGTIAATATSALTVTYSTTTPTQCGVNASSGLVTGLAAGTNNCTIVASQAGDANYFAAQNTQNLSIGKAAQTITFNTVPIVSVGGSGTLTATASSGLAVVFSTPTTGICSVSGTTVTGLAVGTCSVVASQPGDANTGAATAVSQNITIGQGVQTITFNAPTSVAVGGTITLSATATSGLAVTFTSQTPLNCKIIGPTGNTLSGISVGTCTVAANQAGDANYAAATQVTQDITVSNLPPAPHNASMSTTLNTAATFDLAGSISGTGVSGVSIAAQPAHGKVTTSGTTVTYTPNQDYFGNDTFTYRAYGVAGVSANAATVTVTITGRPDPLKDTRVTGLVNVETAVVKRFDKAQLFNFQQRLESRHHAAYAPAQSGPVQTASTNIPAGGAPSGGGQSKGYFNSWQPGTVLEYANDPATLLNAPDRVAAYPGSENAPMYSMMMNMLGNALTTSSLNLGAISNAVGAAQGSEERVELWMAGNLRFGTRTQGGVDTQFSTNGVSVGMDKRMDNHLTLGMGMGYARDKSSIGTDGTNSNASGNSVAFYGSYQRDTGAFIDALLGYGKVTFNTNRYVMSVNDFARASRKGDQVFGSLSFGYEYRNPGGLLWSPYGRYDFSFDRLNEGTESGAGANALYYASQSVRNTQLGLGMRVQSVHQASFGVVQPRARVEYLRGLEATGQTSISYADLLGTQYSVAATTQNTNSMVLGLGSEFLLSDTLRFTLDYQRLRSPGRENYQSINFRLTKDLKGKNDLEELLTESYSSSVERPSGLVVAAGFAYDDNVSRASEVLDKLSDTIYSLMINKAKTIELGEYTRLTVSGFLDVEKFRTYAGLGRVSGGMQGEYKYRSSGEFGTPTWGIFARYSADEYESRLRDGSRTSVGVTLRKPLTDRINLYTALSENRRIGRSAVFNTYDVSGRMNLDYALARGQTLYLTGEYRKGDIVSTGRSSLAILDVAEVFVRDDVFNNAFFAYRMKGISTLWTLGYNYSFGPKDSVDLSWRRVTSSPEKAPTFSAAPIRYIDNQYSVSYLMAF